MFLKGNSRQKKDLQELRPRLKRLENRMLSNFSNRILSRRKSFFPAEIPFHWNEQTFHSADSATRFIP